MEIDGRCNPKSYPTFHVEHKNVLNAPVFEVSTLTPVSSLLDPGSVIF